LSVTTLAQYGAQGGVLLRRECGALPQRELSFLCEMPVNFRMRGITAFKAGDASVTTV
jgi:hypothetical protein